MNSQLPPVATLPLLLDEQARKSPDQRLLVLPNEEVSYQGLVDRANHFARGLAGLGVSRKFRTDATYWTYESNYDGDSTQRCEFRRCCLESF